MLIAGKYEILRELGRGGMGVVYLANHVEMERPCALKMLHLAAMSEPDALARFHREARSASRISHPNVVAVYDFGKTEEGAAYLAMEYVEGSSLDQLMPEATALPPRRAARIIWQVANGLAVAHDLGIVHRDLKPANIMLTRYRHWDDFVKVVDFGIAKPIGATTRSNVTTTGLRVGTPMYMSPEQWTEEVVDHRSDLFALAVITVQLLAGSLPPFQSGLLTSGKQVLDAIPAAAQWPEPVRAVLIKALSPEPAGRYSSAQEFASALVAAVNQWVPPAPGVREPWDERLGTTLVSAVPRRRWRAGLAAGILLAGIAGYLAWSPIRGGGEEAGIQSSAPQPLGKPDSGSTPAPAPAPPPPGSQRPTAAPAGNRSTPAVSPVDSVASLRTIFDIDRADPDSARRVLVVAGRLLGARLADSSRVEVSYRLAEAQLFLGDTAAACGVLREVRPLALKTGVLARSIEALTTRQCH